MQARCQVSSLLPKLTGMLFHCAESGVFPPYLVTRLARHLAGRGANCHASGLAVIAVMTYSRTPGEGIESLNEQPSVSVNFTTPRVTLRRDTSVRGPGQT